MFFLTNVAEFPHVMFEKTLAWMSQEGSKWLEKLVITYI